MKITLKSSSIILLLIVSSYKSSALSNEFWQNDLELDNLQIANLDKGIPTISSTAGPKGNLKYLYTNVSSQIQEKAVQELIQRLLPTRYNEFELKINPNLTSSLYQDAFSIGYNEASQKVLISGTTGVALSFGFHHYLKYYCGCHVSWEGVQLNIPDVLPQVSITKTILDRFRYYQNACTESYSFVWWNWTRWEQEIDWMALNGINLPLASVGQEAIWANVFRSFGLSSEDINEYISGPAFLAWWRMGNLQKWGGPISQYFMSEKLKLLRQILTRMRSFGMLPVLPAFGGTVPISLRQFYPNSKFTQHAHWNGFNSSCTPYFLEPDDDLFIEIGKRFITEMTKEVGTDHVYSCDTFNENRPSTNDTTFLHSMAKATFESMAEGDPQAVWIMQAWAFHDSAFWKPQIVQSYLSGVEVGNLILLDLQADVNPTYIRFESFYNHSFIWCMLQNFGGANILFGNMELINIGVPSARNLSKFDTLIGIGMAPEGINQNYVMYDFMSEMTLSSSKIDTKSWIKKYSRRRYGLQNDLLEQSWTILEAGVYNAFPWVRSNSHTIISGRPGLNRTEQHWYKLTDIGKVVDNFLTAASDPNQLDLFSNNTLFKHDLVDFTRQFLQHTGELIYVQLLKAYYAQNTTIFVERSVQFLDVLNDLDIILSTNGDFMVGKWVKAAESWGQTESEKAILRFNSLNQITLWGPNGEIVDYAAKQWAGIMTKYNQKRWILFLQQLYSSLINHEPFSTKSFNRDVLQQVEIPFTYLASREFPDRPQGNILTEAKRIYGKWKGIFHFCLRNPFKYNKKSRGRGQKLFPKEQYENIPKNRKNKIFARTYAKSIGLINNE